MTPDATDRTNWSSVHGLNFSDVVVEGRPVPGAGPDYLWCAGSLMRLTGGRTHWRGREWGYAMRDPAATTYAPTGFITVTGGEHVIDGGTFVPFPASAYAGGNVPAGTRPVVSTTNAAFVGRGRLGHRDRLPVTPLLPPDTGGHPLGHLVSGAVG